MEETRTPEKTTVIRVPEAVGVFDTVETLQAAIYDLMLAGFSRHDISLLADEKIVEQKLGPRFWQSRHLEHDPEAPRASLVSEEAIGELEGAIAGGFFFVGSYVAMAALFAPARTLAASIAVTTIGGGPAAIVGTLLALRIGRHHKDYYTEKLRYGGMLLWVRTCDDERQTLAQHILSGHSGRDIHIHDWST